MHMFGENSSYVTIFLYFNTFSKKSLTPLQYVPQYNLSSEPNSLQKFNSFLKYLRTSPGDRFTKGRKS